MLFITGTTNLEVETLMDEMRKLQETVLAQQTIISNFSEGFRLEQIIHNRPEMFNAYTGLLYNRFQVLYAVLVSQNCVTMKNNRSEFQTVSSENQLFLTLMRLRQNFTLNDLACRFGISAQGASEIFNAWITRLFSTLSSIPIWPHRSVIISQMPPKFKAAYPTTLAIIDGTEIKTEVPSSLKLQSQCYSSYKSCTTLKALVACDPIGSVLFISELFTGSMSDKQITSESGFLNVLKQLIDIGHIVQGDAIMADKGFVVHKELHDLGLALNIPPFAVNSMQMPQSDVILTQKIAQHRIHVERAIGHIKRFKILCNKIPCSLFHKINEIWTVCALLTSFQNCITKPA